MAPNGSIEANTAPLETGPNLLVRWNSPRRVFARNLRDTLLPGREQPLELTSEPDHTFWSDLFVQHPSRVRFLFDSYAGHVLFVLIVYGLSTSPLLQRRPQRVLDPFANTHIEYYPVSPYLPPVAAPPKPARHALKGQPALAKQEIISVPPEPDNSRQTIVTPNLRILRKEIALPNIMVWADKPAPIQPLAASAGLSKPALLLPPDVIAPAPNDVPASRKPLPLEQPDVIRPAAEMPLNARARLPRELTPSVIPPSPSADSLKTGAINIAQLVPQVSAPKLPVSPQKSGTAAEGSSSTHTAAAPPPPSPSLHGLATGRPQGRMLALSVEPSEIKGPIEPPDGTRKGIFAAGPDGKAGAPGTPNIPGGGVSETGTPGKTTAARNPLEGIYIGPAPAPNAPASGTPNPDLRKAFAAAMHADIDRPPIAKNPSTPPRSKIENEVFGTRKSYSMVLNMPNLTSAVGSWIIRYAELKPNEDHHDISAPVALNKVDPAYPPDLLRDRVEGTVVLYAVIRANGSVDSIRVLYSGDERLNESAVRALSRWRFRPGTKEGVPVDVEAVVQVPFRAQKWKQ